jgi:DNA topoisomerase-1
VDVEFTRELEEMMEGIERGQNQRENVVSETVENLRPILEELKGQEESIGRQLSKTIREMRIAERTLRLPCPECGETLQVIRSIRTKKRFIGCSGYFGKQQCRFSLPLPQMGELVLLNKMCRDCGFQMIQVRIRGRRPMVSCPRCFVNKGRQTVASSAVPTPGETAPAKA